MALTITDTMLKMAEDAMRQGNAAGAWSLLSSAGDLYAAKNSWGQSKLALTPCGCDELQGGVGKDQLNGDAGDDVLFGGEDDDILVGGDGRDGLYGEAGNDDMAGGAGNDYLDGGEGNDTYRLRLGFGFDLIGGEAGYNFINDNDQELSVKRWAA